VSIKFKKSVKVSMTFDEIKLTHSGVTFFFRGTELATICPQVDETISIPAAGQLVGELK